MSTGDARCSRQNSSFDGPEDRRDRSNIIAKVRECVCERKKEREGEAKLYRLKKNKNIKKDKKGKKEIALIVVLCAYILRCIIRWGDYYFADSPRNIDNSLGVIFTRLLSYEKKKKKIRAAETTRYWETRRNTDISR